MKASNHLMIDRLRKEMRRVGINARELSNMANVGRSFVYDILNGKSSNPTSHKIAAVAEVLGISVPYLVAGSSNDNELQNVRSESHIGIPEIISLKQEDNKKDFDAPLHFFRKDLLTGIGTDICELRVFKIKGDSMAPSLIDNDLILVDIGQKNPDHAGVFLICCHNVLLPKRIELILQPNNLPPQLQISSDNPKYANYKRNEEDVDIVGKVVWFSRRFV